MLTIVLGVAAALWIGGGFVIQQHVAAQLPSADFLSPRILLDLMRRPLWLAGIAVMVVGQILGAIALGRASLAVVEPLLAANLLFALPIAAVWRRRHLRRRDWCGAFLLIVGLAGFLLAADPGHAPRVSVPAESWILGAGTVLGLAAGAAWWARRRGRTAQGILLGTAAGLVFGLQDALTNRVDHLFSHGIGHAFTSWQPYTLVAIAIWGLILDQSAFEAAPLTASLPALTVAEPLTGIGLGAALFADPLRLTAAALAVEIICVAAVILAVRLLAQSPLIDCEKLLALKQLEAAKATPAPLRTPELAA